MLIFAMANNNKKTNLAIFTTKNIITSTGSTNTVFNLLENLDESKYIISLILIDSIVPSIQKFSKEKLESDLSYMPFSCIENHKKVKKIYELSELSLGEIKNNFQFGIISIYNIFGEDGRIIGILDSLGIPYLSPSLKTSALCFDKQMTKSLLKGENILVPNGFEVHKNNYNLNAVIEKINNQFGFPVIVKTTSSGASRGVSFVDKPELLENAILNALNFNDEFIIEECLKGQEFSVGVYGKYYNAKALPVVEIKTENQFFDYEAKYKPGKCQEICPAEISPEITEAIQNIALAAYRAVKGESHSRIDIIMSNNRYYVLEINTFPGLTSGSIFPKELKAAGITLGTFLDQSITGKLQKI
jgi:D-alanine-D-alanine ligase